MTIYYLARIKNGEVQQTFDFLDLEDNFFSPYKPVGFFSKSALDDHILNIKRKNYSAVDIRKSKGKTFTCYIEAAEKEGEGVIFITDETPQLDQVNQFVKEVMTDDKPVLSYVNNDNNSIKLQEYQFSWKKILTNSGNFLFYSSLAIVASIALTSVIFPALLAASTLTTLSTITIGVTLTGLVTNALGTFIPENDDWKFQSFCSLSS